MAMLTEFEGETYGIPFDGPDELFTSTISGKFPDEPLLAMDEKRFAWSFIRHAIWTTGKGPFVVLSFCAGDQLTITRWATLPEAVEAKSAIDGGGCGGGCAKVHVIMKVDADNPREARRKEALGAYIAEHGLKPMREKPEPSS